MSAEGRTSPFRGEGGKVCSRRISFVPVRLSEGPLTKPTPAAQPSPRERVFVPHTCRSQYPSGSAQLGGKQPFAGTDVGAGVAP